MKKLRLILIPEASTCDINDFHEIAGNIRQLAPDIKVHVVRRRHLWFRQLAFLFGPSLYVAFYEAKKFTPLRGVSLHGQSMGKSNQYIRMQAAGFKTLKWERISAGACYERSSWGDMVIIKPDRGSEGRDVRLARPENISYESSCKDGKSYLIQQFVVTGENPSYFRALTLFGETLYLRKTINSNSLINNSFDAELPDPVANASHGHAELVLDVEVIEFAKQMASRTFADIPLLGQDIVRDHMTGQLYCLEVNPYGSTWHFSTPSGRKLQQRDGIEYKTQFDAFKLAAKALIEKTRLLAR